MVGVMVLGQVFAWETLGKHKKAMMVGAERLRGRRGPEVGWRGNGAILTVSFAVATKALYCSVTCNSKHFFLPMFCIMAVGEMLLQVFFWDTG